MGADRLELDAQPGGVAERAVGVGEGVEELVAGTSGDHLAGAGEDVHLDDRLVRQPAAEAGRLDAEAGDRAAEGDGAQLRDDEGHQSVGQRGVDEVLVGRHAADVGRACLGVDGDHAVEPADVEAGCVRRLARTEEVGRLLGQPHRLTCGDGGIRRAQSLDCLRVLGPGTSPGSHGSKIARPPETVSARRSAVETAVATVEPGLQPRGGLVEAAGADRAWIEGVLEDLALGVGAADPGGVRLEPQERCRRPWRGRPRRTPPARWPAGQRSSRRPGRRSHGRCAANRRRPSASPAVARASAACTPRNVNGTPSIRPRASVAHGGLHGIGAGRRRGRAAGSATAATVRR